MSTKSPKSNFLSLLYPNMLPVMLYGSVCSRNTTVIIMVCYKSLTTIYFKSRASGYNFICVNWKATKVPKSHLFCTGVPKCVLVG